MPVPSARFVSRLTRDTLALILAGGRGSRLHMLTDWRAKPAVPFAGKFRIIDFTLSNCVNSGIGRISILTQYKSHSLMRHIMEGWNHLRGEHGEFIEILPAQQWLEDESWYLGTADAVYQSLDIIQSHRPKFVVILAGDHIYKMDYGEMLAAHVEARASLTVACHRVPVDSASEFGVMQVDVDNHVIGFAEKPAQPAPLPDDPNQALVSMGIYVFDYAYLAEALLTDAARSDSSHDFGHDIIPKAVRSERTVLAYPISDRGAGTAYWRDVGTIDAYYSANMELLAAEPPLDLYENDWPIYTYQAQLPPAKFINTGDEVRCLMVNSMASGGCVVADSQIRRSLLFSNSQVDSGCSLNGTLALPDVHIGPDCSLTRVILDNGCDVPAGTVIGKDAAADSARFHRSGGGVTVVTRAMLGQEREYQPSVTIPT